MAKMERYIRIEVNDNGDCSAHVNGLTTSQVGMCVGSMLYQIQQEMPGGPYEKEMVFELFMKAMSRGYDVLAEREQDEDYQA
jgi:hypothetical protein